MKYFIKKGNSFLSKIISKREHMFHWDTDINNSMKFSKEDVNKMSQNMKNVRIVNEKGDEIREIHKD